MIFVFGSNLAGSHNGGAALEAKINFNAEPGVGEGPTGRSYALPTMDEDFRPLPLDVIEMHVNTFLGYARMHKTEEFFVTAVGCGIAGFKVEDIAPMFADAPENCSLHRRFAEFLAQDRSAQ